MRIKQLARYLGSLSVNQAVPVYNLNWFRSEEFFKDILGSSAITLVDVGARDSSAEELLPLQKCIHYIGFDADADEVARLNSRSSDYKSAKFIASFVGQDKSNVKFGLHYEGSASSIYPFGKYYNKWFRGGDQDYVKAWIDVEADSLDALVELEVDFIKLDTQGNEYEILHGAKRCLRSALMVEAEVEFIQMYEGKKLAHDVMQFMHEQGFELLYLNRVFGKSLAFRGESRGQMIFGDALFGISRERAIELDVDKQKKYLALLINYGHLDFAYDIYMNSQELQKSSPQVGSVLSSLNRRNKLYLPVKLLIDKLVFFLLAARKTNGLGNDSDRSWPVR